MISISHILNRKSYVESIMMANRSSENLLDSDEEKNAKIEIGLQIVSTLKTCPPIQALEKEDKQFAVLVKDMLVLFKTILDMPDLQNVPKAILKVMNDRSMKEWQLIWQEFAASKKMTVIKIPRGGEKIFLPTNSH
jgi:hypothetical protein